MITLRALLSTLDRIAPPQFAAEWDRIGLQVGDPAAEVRGVVVSLDLTDDCIELALAHGANAIIVHHPPIWNPLKSLNLSDAMTARLVRCLQSGIAVVAAHTNWDAAPGGVADALANLIGLQDVRHVGEHREQRQWKLITFVPEGDSEALIDALAAAGAGEIGLYRRCAFVQPGTGTFEPQAGAKPVIGEVGARQHVDEHRIEMVVPERARASVQAALVTHHPYEEPAYDWVALAGSAGPSFARIGVLERETMLASLATRWGAALGARCQVYGPEDLLVQRVAVAGGAGGSMVADCARAGAQILLTGEAKHDQIIDAGDRGLALVLVGHYASEQPGMDALKERLSAELDVEVVLHAPRPGKAGRAW